MAWKLYYDGGCNLCHSGKLRAERWAERSGQRLEVATLQSDEALEAGFGPDLTLVVDGEVRTRSAAWLMLLRLAPAPLRWLSNIGRSTLLSAIAEHVYTLVARNRYRWFGRRACSTHSRDAKGR